MGILVLYMSLYSRVLLSDSCRGFWEGQRGLPFIRTHHLSTLRHGKIAVCFYQRATRASRGRTNCLTASYGQSQVDRRVPEQSINFMRSESRKCACNFCEAAHLSLPESGLGCGGSGVAYTTYTCRTAVTPVYPCKCCT